MKCYVRICLALTCSIFLSGVAHSEDQRGFGPDTTSQEFAVCISKSDGVTSRMIECWEQEFDRQDKQLNLAYRQLIARTNGVARANLQKVERNWIAFRDAQCEFVYARNGGDYVAHIAYSECRVEITNERLKALQGFLAREDERGL